jgi:hypothetical protein
MYIVFLRSLRRLLVTANVVPILPIRVILMMEALRTPKRGFLQETHGVTSQKMALLNSVLLLELQSLCTVYGGYEGSCSLHKQLICRTAHVQCSHYETYSDYVKAFKLILKRRMPYSGLLGRVVPVRNDVSEERIASIIKVNRISELGR